MIVNRILIKFETAIFKIIPDINQNPSKTFFSSLLETKVKFFQSENRNYQHHFPFSKQIFLSLSFQKTVFSRIFPRDGVEWIFRWKIRETLGTILETSVSVNENKVANRKIFEASAIRKETLPDENWIRLEARFPLVKGERRLHGSPFTVLVEKELLICANQQISMGARLLALWGKTSLLLSRPLCFAPW